jgi:hypothetical protein
VPRERAHVARIPGGPPGVPIDMRKISLRRLLAQLTVLALAGSPAANAATLSDDCDDCSGGEDVRIDHEQVDPHDAAAMLGRSLANALGELKPLSATHLATTWALSGDPLRRAAVAEALEWAFPLFGDGAIIEHLSHERDPRVRAACARAAWVRRASGGDHGVLARLAVDPDAEVRAIAVHAGLQ